MLLKYMSFCSSFLIIARFRLFVCSSVRHTLTEKAQESKKWLANQLAASQLISATHWSAGISCSLANQCQLLRSKLILKLCLPRENAAVSNKERTSVKNKPMFE